MGILFVDHVRQQWFETTQTTGIIGTGYMYSFCLMACISIGFSMILLWIPRNSGMYTCMQGRYCWSKHQMMDEMIRRYLKRDHELLV